jgi:competence ComEA-like helix-hairpin-helix protein
MARRSDRERRFSAREARALLWLLPVLAVVSWLVWEVRRTDGRAKARKEFVAGNPSAKADGNESAEYSSHRGLNPSEFSDPHQNPDGFSRQWGKISDESLPLASANGSNAAQGTRALAQPFPFDPNTIEYHDLIRLGFSRGEALGIIKFRERGKIFEIPEDFAACYQVSESMYRRLAPYIRIGERFRLKKFERRTGNDSSRGSSSLETDSTYTAPHTVGMRPAENRHPVDLNTADSATLVTVSGIGAVTAARIMAYRARLGGFTTVEQLAEVRGVTEQNYERILPQIFVEPAVIQKIDINFAPAKVLAGHPYIRAEALRKLLKNRQLKGGWRTFEELESDHIFEREELEKLGPYLIFN